MHLLIKSKKGGKDFYTILNQNLDKLTSHNKWNHVYNIEEKLGKKPILFLLSYDKEQVCNGFKQE